MYGTVDDVVAVLSAQWNPASGAPTTAQVTTWLQGWSTTVDGEIGHLVSCPVDPSTSPALHGLLTQATVLRVAAQVYDKLYPPAATQASDTRLSTEWRKQAEVLIKGVRAGGLSDGRVLDDVASEVGPMGDETGTPSFSLGDLY